MTEYLKVERPDERYCDGCDLLQKINTYTNSYDCVRTGTRLSHDKTTPPTCPLVKIQVENPTLPRSNSHTIEGGK